MESKTFTVVIEQDEDGYFVADVPALPGCHTQARTLDQLMERTREAIELYLEATHGEAPEQKFVGVQQLEVAAV